ncbi:MAG: hypothetical protein JF597_10010 [Streptomyces sp.]|uniref:hypothetical protein n=1 Tax=Streptomyces sp. TaxID=1931 RepID=UPI0025E98235|nr:hypothetical protein [Streptomyces sp.]MBW8793907.1 hypothetical protein [Streptomyces sp.]
MDQPLTPILVNRRTMQIIDGTHRMLAAVAQGRQTIEAELFDGTGEDAFLLAVSANVDHGLPLSRKDRWIAAKRIIASAPVGPGDRLHSGLSAKAVAALRARSSEGQPQLNAGRGRDGRMRPLDAAKARLRAAELITEHPDASLRHIAALVGLSWATVSDVRRRLASGLPPAGPKHHPAGPAADADEDGTVPDGTGRAEPAAAAAGPAARESRARPGWPRAVCSGTTPSSCGNGPGSSPRCHRTGAPLPRNSRTSTPGNGALLRRNRRSASTGRRVPSAGGWPGVASRPRR